MLRLTAGFFIAALLLGAAPNDTRVADAVQRGDIVAVRALIRQKADVNAAQGDGMTALHWASQRDDLATVRILLAAGANVKAQTRLGAVTPLFLAARNGDAATLSALIEAGGSAAQPDSTGTTPLMLVAASGSADAVKVLLDHGADPNAKESAHGQTALMFAAAHNRDAATRMLIARGANAEAATKVFDPGCGSTFNRDECDEVDQFGNPVKKPDAKEDAKAKEAAKKDEPEQNDAKKENVTPVSLTPSEASNAVKDKANAQRRRNGAKVIGGMTALLFAARDGEMDAARALVEAGANVNDTGTGEMMTPLVMAIANGHYDLAKYFLDHGADPNKASTVGLTPLFATLDMEWAGYSWLPQPITYRESIGYLDLMKALLAKGADPNAKLGSRVWFRNLSGDHGWVDPAGATAFWRAAEATDLAAMHLLVEHGADPKIPSASGVTPLMVAAGIGWAANFSRNAPDSWIPAVQYCLDLGVDINAADKSNYTAVHGAAFRGDTKMVQFLADKGEKMNVVTKEGFSPADMANGPVEHSEQHPETINLLTKLGSPFANNCRATGCFILDGKDRKRLGSGGAE